MAREIIIFECTETKDRFYSSYKNKTNTTDRLELKKYNKKLRKHTLHKEIKK